MNRTVSVPKPDGVDPFVLTLESGTSNVIIGANGSGKTRLAVWIEEQLEASPVQRIPAHKSLVLRNGLNLMSLERADSALRYGHPDARAGGTNRRLGGNPAVRLLSDFDALLQRLFAQQSSVATRFHAVCRNEPATPRPTTDLEQLADVWDSLLPHRKLVLWDATVKVQNGGQQYSGSQLSDGERAIFYVIGQCLSVPKESVIIVDEPEAHIHKAILGNLWDSIERTRADCAFVYLTHDLDYAVARTSSAKHYVRAFHPPGEWEIEALPQDTGLPERIVAELVGSRRPILFVEGEKTSMDVMVYRWRYPDFTVVPIGSCESVIHSVASFGNCAVLHRIGAKGLIDADHRTPEEIERLLSSGVHVLPVAEIENLFLLPDVFVALAEALHCDPQVSIQQLEQLVLDDAARNLEAAATSYTSRRIDQHLKLVTIDAKDLGTLSSRLQSALSEVRPEAFFNDFSVKLKGAIDGRDLPRVLAMYSDKGMLAHAARILGVGSRKALVEKIGRLLGKGEAGRRLGDALHRALPEVGMNTPARDGE